MSERRARRAALLVAGLAVTALLVAFALRGSTTRPPDSTTVALPPAASPVVARRSPQRVRISPAELARARAVARRFLGGYVPYLYGRSPARAVHGVAPSVATSLRRNPPHITPAQRRRRPRLVALRLDPQSRSSIQATATVADGGIATYGLAFTLERRAGRWIVSDLATD